MQDNHLFLFEYIPKGSNVLIYGFGKVGKEYCKQIDVTKWCNIIGVFDRVTAIDSKYKAISVFENIKNINFDYIVIAIEAIETASSIYYELLSLGIEKYKIINMNMRKNLSPKTNLASGETDLSKGVNISLKLFGGIGDYVVCTALFHKIKSIVPDADIYLYGKVDWIRAIFYGDYRVVSESYVNADIELELRHYIKVNVRNWPLIKKEYGLLFEKLSAIVNDRFVEEIRDSKWQDSLLIKRAGILGYNRYRMLGHGNIFDLSEELAEVKLNEDYSSIFDNLGLKKYITINRGASHLNGKTNEQTKVWSKQNYEELIQLLTENYPEYEIIQLGDEWSDKLQGVDILYQSLDLETVKYILAKSTIHIDCEGGLVHLASALGTKCVVLFGPTPIDYYGYKNNINISAGVCSGCMGVTPNWYYDCFKNTVKEDKTVLCMEAIKPNRVFRCIDNYLCYLVHNK